MKRAGIRNTVWLTADMHYTPRTIYDPNRAVFQDFEPFWEFVSGPLHAGTWAPANWTIRSVRRRCSKGLHGGTRRKSRTLFCLQFFGRVDIDGRSEVMTVTLKDVDNQDLWSVDIEPRPDARPGTMLAQHIEPLAVWRQLSASRSDSRPAPAQHQHQRQHDERAHHAGDDGEQFVASSHRRNALTIPTRS